MFFLHSHAVNAALQGLYRSVEGSHGGFAVWLAFRLSCGFNPLIEVGLVLDFFVLGLN